MMKTNYRNIFSVVLAIIAIQSISFAQKGSNLSKKNIEEQAIYMTWNKNTPEKEMNDDIKALKEAGVVIKYSNVKRNEKAEIIAIKVEYNDQNGNTGLTEYNGKNPIDTIKFHRSKNGIGFGETNNMEYALNNFGFNENFDDQFIPQNGMDLEKLKSNILNFNFSDQDGSSKKSKMIIQQNGKEPLVIEDGEIIKGGEGYTEEELNKIKKENEFKFDSKKGNNLNADGFDFHNNDNFKDLKEQMDKMQKQIEQLMPKQENQKEKLKDSKKETEKKENTKTQSITKTYKI